MNNGEFVYACKAEEVAEGGMKHVEVNGKEVVIAKVNGKLYAIADRCGHMNALLSMGYLDVAKNKVTCGFHGAQFDITTGKKIAEANLTPPKGMDPLPESWQKYLEHAYKFMSHIKTHDQERYEVRVEDGTIKLRIA
jgi:nitrite reductase/ring-hydroxylating ferredoxin subunit